MNISFPTSFDHSQPLTTIIVEEDATASNAMRVEPQLLTTVLEEDETASNAMRVEPQLLSRVVEIAAHTLAAQNQQTMEFPSSFPTKNVTLDLVDGLYVGEVKEEEPHRGEPHGRGVLTYYPASYRLRYEGQWKEGEFDGKGLLIHANGDEYEGEWKNGLAHGHGVFKEFSERWVTTGDWKFNRLFGKSKEEKLDENGRPTNTFIVNLVAGHRHGIIGSENFRGGTRHETCYNGDIYDHGVLVEGKDTNSSGDRWEQGIFKDKKLWEGRCLRAFDDLDETLICRVKDGVVYREVNLCGRVVKKIRSIPSLVCLIFVSVVCGGMAPFLCWATGDLGHK